MIKTEPTQPGLLRVLGPWTAVAIVAGSIIGSGIFMKPQAVAQSLPQFEWAIAAWVLGGVLTLFGALALAELGAMMPRAGGNYYYLKEAYGPLWGFLWGWVEFGILRTGAIAALATVFTESLHELLRRNYELSLWQQRSLTAAVIGLLALINAVGVRWGGLVQNLTTWLKVGSLGAIAIAPFALGQANFEYLTQPGPASKSGLIVGFGAAVLGILWAYHGWKDVVQVGEEVRDPQRNLPRALFFGVGIVILVYLSANLAYALVLPQGLMADPDKVRIVAVSYAEELFRDRGLAAADFAGKVISASIMVSVLGALNANLLIGPRTYFALGRDGFFPFLARVHETWRTPVVAIILQAGWAILLVLGSYLIREYEQENPFDTLTNYVMFGAIIFETMAVAAIFRFRRLYPDMPRPYRCWGYPVVPLIYCVTLTLVLINTLYDQQTKSIVGLGFILIGAALYFLFAPRHRPMAGS